MKRTWQGKYVCHDTCWDEQFPRQNVKIRTLIRPNINSRPEHSAEAGTTTLASSAAQFATQVVVTSVTGFSYGSSIGIVLDNRNTFWTTISSDCSTTTLTLDDRLPNAATSGNVVYVPGLTQEEFGDKLGPEDI